MRDGLIQRRRRGPHVWAETLEASRSELNKTRQLCPGGHGLRGDLGLQFRRALQGQAAEIAAD
jgi:transposase